MSATEKMGFSPHYVLVTALRRIANPDNEWGDVDPWDGLAEKSVRDFASNALRVAGESP